MSQLSDAAKRADATGKRLLIPLSKIYVNHDFNCRGQIEGHSIVELMEDIKAKGLIEPVVVRPLWENETNLKEQGFEYSLIAGFRRTTAYRALQAPEIPAVVRNVESDFECADINAVENLQRTDLTLWQECRSIKHYWAANWTQDEIAGRISKSRGWVQTRIDLLEMPEKIQQAADQGYILAGDVRGLRSYKGTELLVVAGRLIEERKKDSSARLIEKVKKVENPTKKKYRRPEEIFKMMHHIRETCMELDLTQTPALSELISPQGNSLITRVLAWCAAEISTLELHESIEAFCKLLGYGYEIPKFEESNLD